LRPAQNKRPRAPAGRSGKKQGGKEKGKGKGEERRKKEKGKTRKYLTHSLGGMRDFKSRLFGPKGS